MLPRKCSRLGLTFWSLNKYPAFSNSWVEKCYLDSTHDKQKEADLTQKRREMCVQWHKCGQQELSHLQDALSKSGSRPQVTPVLWRGIARARVSTPPTAMVHSQRGVCSTPQEPRERTQPQCQRTADTLGSTKPDKGILSNLSILPQTSSPVPLRTT